MDAAITSESEVLTGSLMSYNMIVLRLPCIGDIVWAALPLLSGCLWPGMAITVQDTCMGLLNTLPVNINGYVLFLINMLDTIVKGGNVAK